MFLKNDYDKRIKLDPRRSDLTPHRTTHSHVPGFQHPQSDMTVQGPRGESLTKQLLLKTQREKLVRSYKEIVWQQRTMDDSLMYDVDPFSFIDEE